MVASSNWDKFTSVRFRKPMQVTGWVTCKIERTRHF